MPKIGTPYRFGGFRSPRYTSTPDEVFDELLAPGRLTEAELRVLLYIVRRTFGFKKDSDTISLSQITDGIVRGDGTRLDWGAGVGRPAAVRAIKGLEAKGIITAERHQSARRGNETSSYSLRMADDDAPQYLKETRVVSQRNQGSIRKAPSLVSEENPQETDQQTVRQETEDSNARPLQKKERGTTTTSQRRMNIAGEGTPDLDVPPRPPLSPYIAGVIEDISRDLGDLEHSNSNITQALRLWQEADLDEDAFVALLREVKTTVRHYQAGGIGNKMAYFFQTLRDRLSKQDGHA